MSTVCKKCGQTKGHHSAVMLRCPIAPPFPVTAALGLLDRFPLADRWSQGKPRRREKLTNPHSHGEET